mmetsp:Transcript_42670/g.84174  ORF Transcript_42670/g.84174 Transcript_42670/m.84174 type:complete len:98 (+) Transcript_42670:117-410(+)
MGTNSAHGLSAALVRASVLPARHPSVLFLIETYPSLHCLFSCLTFDSSFAVVTLHSFSILVPQPPHLKLKLNGRFGARQSDTWGFPFLTFATGALTV